MPNYMSDTIEKKMQKSKQLLHRLRQKLIVRVWSLAKRLDPKTLKEEGKKRKGQFSRLGNKGNK